jgi:hypothetical protein
MRESPLSDQRGGQSSPRYRYSVARLTPELLGALVSELLPSNIDG